MEYVGATDSSVENYHFVRVPRLSNELTRSRDKTARRFDAAGDYLLFIRPGLAAVIVAINARFFPSCIFTR